MRLIFIFLVCFPNICFSQIQESFNDGDYQNNPAWSGSEDYFIVNTSNELQLSDTDARESYLSTASQAIEEASWQMRVKMDFNPSSSNFTRIFLACETEALTNANNALFVELGSTDDNICLYKIENGSKEKLIEGAVDRINLSAVDVLVKVTRTDNNWTLAVDLGSGWIDEGQATFELNFPSSHFGIYCKYTKTRANKFFFDDISVEGQPYRDKTPPEVRHFELINGTQLRLTFNEALDESSIGTEDFMLENSQRQPSSFSYNKENLTISLFYDPILDDTPDETLQVSNILDLDGNALAECSFPFSYERIKVNNIELTDRQTIKLTFSKTVYIAGFDKAILKIDELAIEPIDISTEDELSFHISLPESLDNGRRYTLQIEGITDAINDAVPAINTTISHYSASRFDVVFNEWMADPNPSMGLPEVEFIELFNNSAYDISLKNWSLQINDKAVILPDSSISSNGFICLVSATDMDKWNSRIPTAFVKSLPALNNSGFEMSLFNESTAVVDAFIYQPTTIPGEGFKKDGGWSVERIDSQNLSGEADNFHWSMDLNGGTPGSNNSVQAKNTDTKAPHIASLTLLDAKTLNMEFNETMNFNTFSVEIEPQLQIHKQVFDEIFLNTLKIEFENTLLSNAIHQLNAIDINDLAGNKLELNEPFLFGMPDTLELNDVLINEVLFNPYPDGADFVELYNTSDKLIDLSDMYFAQIEDDAIEKLYPVSDECVLLHPHAYVAITTNKESLLQHYTCSQPNAIFEASGLPSFPDDEGLVAIGNKKGIILDKFSYHQNMHFDLLKDKEGVSLERLSWQLATQESSNWQSAASTAGFATPGYINSQQLNASVETTNIVSLSPEVFTPNGDGIDDWLQIHITPEELNTIATIRIFDANGKEVRYLINNQSLPNSHFFLWDGLNDANAALKPGIYIIYVQCVYPSGKVHEEKLSCVIGIKSN
ncbi:lamin tail domain-containing protein [Carboxylicivirga sp. A043]|uniref:lamin tail domain-containing protein n=1 Tax=Carboxylicivirga litoralis TaxID=2816963 RepID=UPI0021CB77D5|nr:lamin tail domain-containing protein [Carboxylicivirga sp. A043]MCU4158121.1 lamin tail domain-containing protein [Carboxylicivirga sp. A043]